MRAVAWVDDPDDWRVVLRQLGGALAGTAVVLLLALFRPAIASSVDGPEIYIAVTGPIAYLGLPAFDWLRARLDRSTGPRRGTAPETSRTRPSTRQDRSTAV